MKALVGRQICHRDVLFGDAQLLFDIDLGRLADGDYVIAASRRRADQRGIDIREQTLVVDGIEQRDDIKHGRHQLDRTSQRRTPIRHMRDVGVNLASQPGKGPLLKSYFGYPPRSPQRIGGKAKISCVDDIDRLSQVRGRLDMRRQDERNLKLRRGPRQVPY